LNIVFDFGGVLFNWQPQVFMARLLPARAATHDAAQALVADFFEGFGGDWGEFDRGAIAPALLAERIARRTGLSLGEVRRVMNAVPKPVSEVSPMMSGRMPLIPLKFAAEAMTTLVVVPRLSPRRSSEPPLFGTIAPSVVRFTVIFWPEASSVKAPPPPVTFSTPTVSVVVAAPFPRMVMFPPRLIVGIVPVAPRALRRLLVFVPLLSRVSVAVGLTVTVVNALVPAPA